MADVSTPSQNADRFGSPVLGDHWGTYWYDSNPTGSVKVPDANTRITVLSEALDGSTMTVQIGPPAGDHEKQRATCTDMFGRRSLVGGGRTADDVTMAVGGFSKLPSGTVVVALALPNPAGGGRTVRVVVHALNRQRALTRLSNLGFRGARLSGNAEPPTPDEITAVLHHPDGLVWRYYHARTADPWHPISALNRVVG